MRQLFTSFLLCLLLALGFGTTSCVEPIDAGSVGIKFDKAGGQRGVSNIEEVSGWVWYMPMMTKIVEIPVTMETAAWEPFPVNAQGGSQFHVSPTLNYHVDATKASEVYVKFKRPLADIETSYIFTSVSEACRIAANAYTADSLINNRSAYEKMARELLRKEIEPRGFVVEQFTTGLTPPDGLVARINEKNETIQKTLRAEQQALQAVAEGKIERAKAESESAAIRLRADAKAYANQKEQQTLTPLLIEQQRIQKWNGVLPQHVLGNNTSLMMGMK